MERAVASVAIHKLSYLLALVKSRPATYAGRVNVVNKLRLGSLPHEKKLIAQGHQIFRLPQRFNEAFGDIILLKIFSLGELVRQQLSVRLFFRDLLGGGWFC